MAVENPSIASEVPASASETILNYWKRRAYITDTFINKTPADEVLQVESKSGPADVRVLSTMCEIPDELRDPNKMQAKENVTMAVFVPGMFEVAQNYGSHPLESRLAGGLLTSETDAVIMLKAEGQDRKAFEEVHKTTSTAAFQVLEKQITEYLKMHPDCKTINLKVLGYSEGSTQGASLTARIIEHIQEAKAEGRPAIDGLDTLNMKEYLSICGGGLAGNAKVADVNLGEVLINNIKAMNQGQANESLAKEAGAGAYGTVSWQDTNGHSYDIPKGTEAQLKEISAGLNLKTFEIDSRLVEGFQKSLEVGAGKLNGEQAELRDQEQESQQRRNPDDVKNVSKWLARFFATNVESLSKSLVTRAAAILPGGVDTLNRLIGNGSVLKNPVPLERVKALFTMNPDYETIVNSPDTKLTVVAGSKDIYFPGEVVATNLKEIVAASDDPERAVGKTVLIKGDIPHEFPHGNTDGLAYMIELLKNKAYGLENTNNAQVLV